MNNISILSKLVCYFKILFQGVWINRFQLFLTTLTMSFGSLGLALTIFLGDGALHVLWSDLEDLLGNWVIVYPTPGPDMELMQQRLSPHFTEDDLQYVKNSNGGARLVSPAIFNQLKLVEYRSKGGEMFWDGITAELADEEIFRPVRGRDLSSEAFAGNAWECMVTEDVAAKLGLDLAEEPSILLGNYLFKVVGITVSPPRNEHFRQRITVPYTLARILWMPPGDIGHIVVAWRSVDDMGPIMEEVGKALDEHRGKRTYYLSSTQFQIQSSRKIVKNFIVVGTTQSLFCIMIASIGVLNVMLTNVARRTREFAIRIAMGARQRDILIIVLAESFVTGIIGALIGLALALGSAPFIGKLMAAGIEEATKLSPDISFKGIFLPLLICGLCSLTAGVVPAVKVRKMDILSALRNDS